MPFCPPLRAAAPSTMDARRRSHQAYLQIQYGDTGQLITTLNQMIGKNNYKLTMKGSNRWIIATDQPLTNDDLEHIRQQSVKRLDTRSRDEQPIRSTFGRRSTFRRTISPSPSPSNSETSLKPATTWKSAVTKLLHVMSILQPKTAARSHDRPTSTTAAGDPTFR
ncbi:hypothetical protein QBC40DRAFT_348362 [Triangularia verruculosa]|uniref:Uncharacterized protein n=1 Tax=Triangularia verruculosa TaxID=2587418 RepID=A0AAN6XK58_9PEZI|nr:hypothetical protein QBC40DRAFT_348362 [Triangularia verruculosa]